MSHTENLSNATAWLRTEAPKRQPRLLDIQADGGIYHFELLTAHYQQRRHHKRRDPVGHVHDVYHLVLYTLGSNRFVLENRLLPCCPGTLVVTAPGQKHEFGPTDAGDVTYCEITFQFRRREQSLAWAGERLLSHFAGEELPDSRLYWLNPKATTEARNCFRRVIEHARPDQPGDRLVVQQKVAELLTLTIRSGLESSQLNPGQEDALEAARSFLAANFSKSVTVAQLARMAHYSRGHFNRRFRDRYGQTPIAYLHDLRISAGANLLRCTHMRCKEIASRVGYADGFCFSKAFRRRMGVSPEAYRGRFVKAVSRTRQTDAS